MNAFNRFLQLGGDWFALATVSITGLQLAHAVPDASTEVGRLLIAAQGVLAWLVLRAGKAGDVAQK